MSSAAGAEPYVLSILVMPAQANTLGVMHGGHMMSWMDMAAWVVATRAVSADQTVFFKAVDDCVWSGPVHAGEVCHVEARLERVGTTSLTVALDARAEDPVNASHPGRLPRALHDGGGRGRARRPRAAQAAGAPRAPDDPAPRRRKRSDERAPARRGQRGGRICPSKNPCRASGSTISRSS